MLNTVKVNDFIFNPISICEAVDSKVMDYSLIFVCTDGKNATVNLEGKSFEQAEDIFKCFCDLLKVEKNFVSLTEDDDDEIYSLELVSESLGFLTKYMTKNLN